MQFLLICILCNVSLGSIEAHTKSTSLSFADIDEETNFSLRSPDGKKLPEFAITTELEGIPDPIEVDEDEDFEFSSQLPDPENLSKPAAEAAILSAAEAAILCDQPPAEDGSDPIYPDFGDYLFEHELTNWSTIAVEHGLKPNPDGVPVCSKWFYCILEDCSSNLACTDQCLEAVNTCRYRKQEWKYSRWLMKSKDEDVDHSSTNGVFDCVGNDLSGACGGPCRSAAHPMHEVACYIRRSLCSSVFMGSSGNEPSTTTTTTTTTTATTTIPTTSSTSPKATHTSQATHTEETPPVTEPAESWTAGNMIGTTMMSAGGAAMSICLCCRCSGSSGMADFTGIKDFGATVGGGADDVSRLCREKCETEQDRAGNKDAMEAELAARMSVGLTVSRGNTTLNLSRQ